MSEQEQTQWILIRDGEVRNVFKNRREAISHYKELLNQTLKDLDKQDKTNTYDYSIKTPLIEIKPIQKRESYLGL